MAPFLDDFQIRRFYRRGFRRILFCGALCGALYKFGPAISKHQKSPGLAKIFGAITSVEINSVNKKLLIFLIGFIVLAAGGALVFYFYGIRKNNSIAPSDSDNFIQTTAQAPAVEGNIVNSGIAGKVVIGSDKPFEASLAVYKSDNPNTPFISVRAHSDGTFQIPLRPGFYILKPLDPDGPAAPVRSDYSFVIGSGQWLQVKIEYR
ncbi:MAG: hypothetical protein UV93_C0001G0133 [Candidatus Azambacteria bacterium GW2011_GWC2_43_27]|nr:MAG: hypothetical protein UU33_C0001G0534 [Candidatus Azambacteria bacterium GW2011_GWF1_41_10]KKS49567.1 MAG: hypothetical protein UV14_C0001G0313 [Candidatus Azambacteria bacterium GW2011_GWF2_42_22]KKT03678.1 MAG: hypothetical protein UV81_C0001G0274 [Candidatus Azambacteria bacterium GW2011_GWD1_43_18]KKT12832.1 MAG: hypothetical protein UV93_C0001G0133 [Candidatus Azambacteria bacterium GW2011_GWC2_43_27]